MRVLTPAQLTLLRESTVRVSLRCRPRTGMLLWRLTDGETVLEEPLREVRTFT